MPDKASVGGDVTFVVERVRLVAYSAFCLVILTGVALTTLYGHIDLRHTLLTRVFGYNNLCVFVDAPPATYVLPTLWAITLAMLLCYMGGQWLQMRAEVDQGTLDRGLYGFLSRLKLFEAFTMAAFSTIFAVQPEAWDHTLYIHTAPFFLLQIGLVSLAMSNTLHGIKSGYWRRLGLPAWFEPGAKAYVVFFALLVAFKIPAAINAMAGSRWWEQSTSFIRLAHLVDQLFFLCAVIIPMMKAAFFVWTRGDRLDVVRLTLRTQTSG